MRSGCSIGWTRRSATHSFLRVEVVAPPRGTTLRPRRSDPPRFSFGLGVDAGNSHRHDATETHSSHVWIVWTETQDRPTRPVFGLCDARHWMFAATRTWPNEIPAENDAPADAGM